MLMKEVDELRELLEGLARKEQNQLKELQKQLDSVSSRASLLIDHPPFVADLCSALEPLKKGGNASLALSLLDKLRARIAEPFSAHVKELEAEVEQERAQVEKIITAEAHDLTELTSLAPFAREKLSGIIKETKEHMRAYELEADVIIHIKDSLRLFASVEYEIAKLAQDELELVNTTRKTIDNPSDASIDNTIFLWKMIDGEIIRAVKKELAAISHLQGLFEKKFSTVSLTERYSKRRGVINWILGKGRITLNDIERDIKLMTNPQQFHTYSTTLLLDFKDLLTKEALDFLRTKTPEIEREITAREIKYTTSIGVDNKTGLKSPNIIGRDVLEVTKKNKTVGFLMTDIDKFKNVNGYYGYDIGDEILKFVASTIRETVRDKDQVYRWGGEEILVILPGASKDGALKTAERIRAAIQQKSKELMNSINQKTYVPQDPENHSVDEITVSIGVGMYPETVKTEEDIKKKVGDCVKLAKGSGRNRVVAA